MKNFFMFAFSENQALKNYNTFGIKAFARYFLSIESPDDLIFFFSKNPPFQTEKSLILGGGSNVLFLEDFKGLIIHPLVKGVQVISDSSESIEIEVGAGEVWDDFVSLSVENGWGGIENLSLIPGLVGAAPVQNIGAYGVEVKSSILRVNTINLQTLGKRIFSNQECCFGYRSSVFKNELKNQYLITSVVFLLKKKPALNFTYGALKNEVLKFGKIDLKSLRSAVISIRESKLPDPRKLGNAGSFFKNPSLDVVVFKELQHHYPQIPAYECQDNQYKIPAGWLIEKAGWKGRSYKNAAVHDRQALILVNRDNATGKEVFELAELIKNDVYIKFGIKLEPEVNIV